jgi:hypothetical protein
MLQPRLRVATKAKRKTQRNTRGEHTHSRDILVPLDRGNAALEHARRGQLLRVDRRGWLIRQKIRIIAMLERQPNYDGIAVKDLLDQKARYRLGIHLGRGGHPFVRLTVQLLNADILEDGGEGIGDI